ncbi:MAG: aconitate hydratase [Candidatus Moranbacteria bacterium]|nr:aconitate hydratase [Candidatus Moranbacteria bacterium]
MSKFISTTKLEKIYKKMADNLEEVQTKFDQPLTLTEKIIFTHLYDQQFDLESVKRGETELALAPDRVAMQDATAQMAVLQFISTNVPKVKKPTSVHCDHLIAAIKGGDQDLEKAKQVNNEVYRFLESAAKKYGIDYWEPGSGIIHQIILENYAFSGGLLIGTDSHTPTAGGLGMLAIGVGGADAVDVMTDQPWWLKMPKIVGVKLTGELKGWASAKDVILYICGKLTVKGGTGKVLEYFGPGAESLSATGKATITNMGAEVGATSSIFPFDESMKRYLKATDRKAVADLMERNKKLLEADDRVKENPNNYYDQVIEIDLAQIEPAFNGPDTPDAYHRISEIKQDIKKLNLPEKTSAALIGSCTNSSYEDFQRIASVAKSAKEQGLSQVKTRLLISPGSTQIAQTLADEGVFDLLEKMGAVILTNSCGPCIGQWERGEIPIQEKQTIVTTFNRNFKQRNDGREETYAFLASAEMTFATALAGRITFDPTKDKLTNDQGEEIELKISTQEHDVPKQGFSQTQLGYEPPAEDGSDLTVDVDFDSDRIQLLEPFNKWNLKKDFKDLPILLKVKGKCTTDHISPAGKWLKYRGHLDNISQNMYSGALNLFNGKVGMGINVLNDQEKEFHQIARDYKKQGIGWVVVADENYGEGSSREHAAMEPRFLGATSILAKSFARIAETNLKKQGILPLWLENEQDYERFKEKDRITVLNLQELEPNKTVKVRIEHQDGEVEEITTQHTLSPEQIEWIKQGSALNKAAKDLKQAQ